MSDKNKQTLTPEEFREKIQGVLRKAQENGMRISREEVSGFFSAYRLSEEQLKLVYDFLLSKRISVSGYEKTAAEPHGGTPSAPRKKNWSQQEEKILQQYMDDLDGRSIPEEGSAEYERIFAEAAKGSDEARGRLAEVFLPDIVRIAKEMYTGEVLLPDMIQEGNLRLIMALNTFDYAQDQAEEKLQGLVDREIRNGILALVEEQKDVQIRDNRMVQKVEDLNDHIEVLKEDLGRKVYIDEVAEFMDISEGEVEDILRLAGQEAAEETGTEEGKDS